MPDSSETGETGGKSATGATRSSKFWVRSSVNLELSPVSLVPHFSRVSREYRGLVRCEEAVDEGVLCELRRRVKIELRHDLRFMKLDGLR